MNKDAISKMLGEKLNTVADSIIKSLEAPQEGESKSPKNEPETPKPDANAPAAQTDVHKAIADLTAAVEELKKSSKSDTPAQSDDVKKELITTTLKDFVKSLGLDMDNVDASIDVKEKKKSVVEQDDKVEKYIGDKSEEIDLEKDFDSLNKDEKSEALDYYFKSIVSK